MVQCETTDPTPDQWTKCVEHGLKIEEEPKKLALTFFGRNNDDMHRRLIIDLSEDTQSESSDKVMKKVLIHLNIF